MLPYWFKICPKIHVLTNAFMYMLWCTVNRLRQYLAIWIIQFLKPTPAYYVRAKAIGLWLHHSNYYSSKSPINLHDQTCSKNTKILWKNLYLKVFTTLSHSRVSSHLFQPWYSPCHYDPISIHRVWPFFTDTYGSNRGRRGLWKLILRIKTARERERKESV